MKVWAIGDLHLSFSENVDKPMNIFGRGWDNHAQRLKDAWLSCVAEEDVVVIPGDISWALKLDDAIEDLNWIHNLPGTKLVSKGNHDLWWARIKYLNSLYDDVVFMQNDCYHSKAENLIICATRGWPFPGSGEYSNHDAKIYRRELLRLGFGLEKAKKLSNEDTKLIVALHYPPTDSTGRETEFTKMLEAYGVDTCIFGHLHGGSAFMSAPRGRIRNISYQLVSLDYLGAKPKLIYEGE